MYIFKTCKFDFSFFLFFFFFFATPHGIYGVPQSRTHWCDLAAAAAWHVKLSWPTRDQTLTPFSRRQSLSHWTPGKLLYGFKIFIFFNQKVWKKAGSYYPLLLLFSLIQLFATPWTVACQGPLSWNSPGKNTGVGCHCLLQGIFMTQGSNPCLL